MRFIYRPQHKWFWHAFGCIFSTIRILLYGAIIRLPRPEFCWKSSKRWFVVDFCGIKNAWKSDRSYAFWCAPRTIRRPWAGFYTGAQNHAKLRENASKITAKWARKNIESGVAMVKNPHRRLTCKNSWKRVHFCRSRCCFAHAMDRKNTQRK